MSTEVMMPALSPTMEKGTLAKWLVKEGDRVRSGTILAEIETDKATMEFEAVDDGSIVKIIVPEGTDDVLVGTVIAIIGEAEESAVEDTAPASPENPDIATAQLVSISAPSRDLEVAAVPVEQERPHARLADKVKISPLAARIAAAKNIEISNIVGSGPAGRIRKSDLGLPAAALAAPPVEERSPILVTPAAVTEPAAPPAGVPAETIKLSSMRKTIARRLAQSKQQIPHIYLTVDIRLDSLLTLRAQINDELGDNGVKVSVNDLLIKAQALALMATPCCNVQFSGDTMFQFKRADIAVAVSIPGGLITPIVKGADSKSVSAIASEMKDLATCAREGKLSPDQYQGGTASLSNMGMFGIKQFDAVINPPQAMILAIGAGELRPYVIDGALGIATVMSATGSFDHRAIDGADGAQFMQAFKSLVENPLRLVC